MPRPSPPRIVKKYGNRRLYDTTDSRYITLEELGDRIRGGDEARVVNAQSGADLTQATLTQIIIEGRGAARLLPVPLLTQLVRMGDDALAEFLGHYLAAALDLYLQARHGAQLVAPYNPFAGMPFAFTNALARLLNAPGPWAAGAPDPVAPRAVASAVSGADPPDASGDPVQDLRRELAELKQSLAREKHGPPRPTARKRPAADRTRKRPT